MSTTETPAPITIRLKKRKKVKIRSGDEPRTHEENGHRAIRIDFSPPVPARGPDIPLKVIQVEPAKTTVAPREQTKRYWCGVTDDAPFDNRAFGGVAFQRWSGVVEADPSTGEMILTRASRGLTVDLTEYQVKLVCEAVARRVVRTVGNRADATGNYRCDTLTVTATGFRPEHGDLSVGRYLYMVEVHEQMPVEWRKSNPPTMVPAA